MQNRKPPSVSNHRYKQFAEQIRKTEKINENGEGVGTLQQEPSDQTKVAPPKNAEELCELAGASKILSLVF